jgi:hypothetical protein
MVIIANSSGSGRGEFPCRIRIVGHPRSDAIRRFPYEALGMRGRHALRPLLRSATPAPLIQA